MKEEEIKKVVREGYGRMAAQGGSCCFPTGSCCGSGPTAETISRQVGRTQILPQSLGQDKGRPLAVSGCSWT